MILAFSILIMLIGILGVILPIIPGLALVWLGAFMYAFFTDFSVISWNMLIILGGMAGFGFLIDFWANILGVKKYGASKLGMLGAIIGGIVGIFMGGITGLIFGPFIGAFALEYLVTLSIKKSFKVSLGTFMGFLVGTFVKFILGIIMLGLFIFWLL